MVRVAVILLALLGVIAMNPASGSTPEGFAGIGEGSFSSCGDLDVEVPAQLIVRGARADGAWTIQASIVPKDPCVIMAMDGTFESAEWDPAVGGCLSAEPTTLDVGGIQVLLPGDTLCLEDPEVDGDIVRYDVRMDRPLLGSGASGSVDVHFASGALSG